jgi:hypothetical protein
MLDLAPTVWGKMASPESLVIATSPLEIAKTEVEWHKLLMSEQFYILCQHGIERVGSSSSPLDINQYNVTENRCKQNLGDEIR